MKMAQRFFEKAVHASIYAQFRPVPPPQLQTNIISFLRKKYDGPLDLCVDVGCGSGQCFSLFTSHFTRLVGTDVSSAQIQVAREENKLANVVLHCSPAEIIPVDTGSAQVVNAGQACHWFDLPAFFTEAERVLCPNGVLSIMGYTWPHFVHPTKGRMLQKHLDLLYEERTAGYWGRGRKDLDDEYVNIHLPFKETTREEVWSKEETVTVEDFVNYLRTWSGFQNFVEKNGQEAGLELLKEFATSCAETLGSDLNPEHLKLTFKRKYFLLMGRKT